MKETPIERAPVRTELLRFSPDGLEPGVIEQIAASLRSDVTGAGRRLENEIAIQRGMRAALATSSGATALWLALTAAGIGEGDEVIHAPLDGALRERAIRGVRARSVHADLEPTTGNLDHESVQRALTESTRALIVTHENGLPCDLDALRALADAHGLVLIEDAGGAFAAVFHRRPVGTVGDFSCFRFHATGRTGHDQGGVILSQQAEALTRATADAMPSAISGIQALAALAELHRMEATRLSRAEVVARYDAAFADLPLVRAPAPPPAIRSACTGYALRVDTKRSPLTRDAIVARLLAEGIEALPFEALAKSSTCLRARALAADSFRLPLSDLLRYDDVEDIVLALRRTLT